MRLCGWTLTPPVSGDRRVQVLSYYYVRDLFPWLLMAVYELSDEQQNSFRRPTGSVDRAEAELTIGLAPTLWG